MMTYVGIWMFDVGDVGIASGCLECSDFASSWDFGISSDGVGGWKIRGTQLNTAGTADFGHFWKLFDCV